MVIIRFIAEDISCQCTKCSKGICREKNFFSFFICKHNLRPMNHRYSHKFQIMSSQTQSIAVFNFHHIHAVIKIIKLPYKLKCFFISNDFNIWISFYKLLYICAVVWFHMIYNQVIQISTV